MLHELLEQEIIKGHPHSTDTAEKHMVTHVCTGQPADTVDDYLKKLRQCGADTEVSDYAYVVGPENILLGYIPVAKLLRADRSTRLSEIMGGDVVSVHLSTDRERAARLAIHYKLGAMPVVDKDRHLLGVINSHNILQILHEEHVEDTLKIAGFKRSHNEAFVDMLKARAMTMIGYRTPWLLAGLVGGMLVTFIVSIFEKPLAEHVVLAFFIPALLYIAGAAGAQTEALYLRIYDTAEFKTRTFVFREIKIGTAVGFICSALIFLFTLAFFKDLKVATIVGTSMLISIVLAVYVSALIPAILVKLKKDPVLGAGPSATVAKDALTILAYLIVAQIVL